MPRRELPIVPLLLLSNYSFGQTVGIGVWFTPAVVKSKTSIALLGSLKYTYDCFKIDSSRSRMCFNDITANIAGPEGNQQEAPWFFYYLPS